MGTQLALLQAAQVLPEAIYGSPERKTTDFFVVLPRGRLLVEAKSSRPSLGTRTGVTAGDIDLLNKIGHARKQINATVELLEQGNPAVAHLPRDRPVRGLVVTLEPFHNVNTILCEGILPSTAVPTATVSSHDLENVVAILASEPDAGSRILAALTHPGASIPPSLRTAVAGLKNVANPILAECWQRWCATAT